MFFYNFLHFLTKQAVILHSAASEVQETTPKTVSQFILLKVWTNKYEIMVTNRTIGYPVIISGRANT